MTNENAVIRLLAMGHAARIAVLRLLAYAPEGMMSSALAEAVGIPRNGMSPHLKVLAEAGLIKASKAGRTVTYTLIQDALQDVAAFVGDISRPEAAVRSQPSGENTRPTGESPPITSQVTASHRSGSSEAAG